jgi:3-dehydroquinate synthase class II
VLIARAGGGGRAAVVGRCKVEPRPTLRVEFETSSGGGERASIFLQQAETVRLATSNNGPTPVTALTPTGDVLLVRSTGRGTHVGRAIGGRVAER